MQPATPLIDGDTATNLVVIIGAIVTGLTSLLAAFFAGLASLRAGRTETNTQEAKVSSQSNAVKLATIESQTNSLSHAVARVVQTDADARLETAKALPTLPVPPVVVAPVVNNGNHAPPPAEPPKEEKP